MITGFSLPTNMVKAPFPVLCGEGGLRDAVDTPERRM
jgi:hypothetical protein